MMVGKEEADHEHVSLLCSTQVGRPSVSLWHILWTALISGHWPDERRYINNHFIHSRSHSHWRKLSCQLTSLQTQVLFAVLFVSGHAHTNHLNVKVMGIFVTEKVVALILDHSEFPCHKGSREIEKNRSYLLFWNDVDTGVSIAALRQEKFKRETL